MTMRRGHHASRVLKKGCRRADGENEPGREQRRMAMMAVEETLPTNAALKKALP